MQITEANRQILKRRCERSFHLRTVQAERDRRHHKRPDVSDCSKRGCKHAAWCMSLAYQVSCKRRAPVKESPPSASSPSRAYRRGNDELTPTTTKVRLQGRCETLAESWVLAR